MSAGRQELRAPAPRARTRRRPLRWVVAVLAGAFALTGIWAAVVPGQAPTQADQVRTISQTLRCPTCLGEDVADSASPIAEAMRLVVAEQVAEGRSKEEIQAWFTARYGDEVLLDPPRRGAGWVLWLLPMGVLGVGAGVLVAGRRRRLLTFGVPAAVVAVLIAAWTLPGDRFEEAPPAGADVQVSAIPVLSAAAAESPGNLTLRLALARGLEDEGRFDDAAQEYAAAARLSPMEPDIRYRHAFALLRGGDQDRAEDVLTQSLDIDADHPATLLLLGSIRQQQDGADGTDLLHRFLQVAPDHPSAAEVRAWLEEED